MVSKKKNILIIGGAGRLATITVNQLASKYPNFSFIAVDSREVNKNNNSNVQCLKIKYTRNAIENLFREHKINTILHLGRKSLITPKDSKSLSDRLNSNINNINHLLNLALINKIEHFIYLSTYHVYGARADNPVFLDEEKPLKASVQNPDLAEVVELDQIISSWMHQNKEKVVTTILRPCSIVGPLMRNTISQYLKSKLTPTPMDFNPMFQFLNVNDMVNIFEYIINHPLQGIFNVAPEGVISVKKSKEILGSNLYSFPVSLVSPFNKFLRTKFDRVPTYLLEFLTYSCLLNNKKLKEQIGNDFFKYDSESSIRRIKKSL